MLWILFFLNISFSQDFIKKDTILSNGKIYTFSHISFGSSSLTKYLKVFTCNNSDYIKIEKEIIKCVKNRKVEFTEFYLLSVSSNESTLDEKNVLMSLLRKIDNERMKLNLTTTLIDFNYSAEKNLFQYLLSEPEKKLEEIKNYKIRINKNNVCKNL